MSERRYSPLATLFAATFLFRIGNAVAALALPWFVLSHTKSAARAGATAASSVIATIIGAWVGGGLVDRFGRAPVALIRVWWAAWPWRASHCSMPLAPSRTLG